MKTPFLSLVATTMVMLACGSVEIDPQQQITDASAAGNFSKYISIGSGLTAGYASGGLYREAQINSFPSIVAKQMKVLGTNDFSQPLFAANEANGTGYLEAKSMSPLMTEKTQSQGAIRSISPLLFTKHSGQNHNFGVPQLKMMDIGKSGLGNPTKSFFNPFFERILPDSQIEKSYLDYVKSSDYTFFTCEIGQNDVLNYALSGGTATLSPVESFALSCRQLMTGLTANKATGIVFNIANVEVMPAFTKVADVKEKGTIYIVSNGSVRQATDDEIILTETISKIGKKHEKGTNYGLSKDEPILNSEVLDAAELKKIKFGITDLNGVIATETKNVGVKVLDINQLYASIASGTFNSDGVAVKGNISKDGFFSVDGVYPSPRGQAIIANAIIKMINSELTAKSIKNLSTVDIGKYKSVEVK